MYKLPKISLALALLLAIGCSPFESTDPPDESNVARSCHTNDDCPDDNLFCTGTERCSPTGECIGTGNPCLSGEQCNEDASRCDNCAIDENCDDHNACTVEACVDGQCAYSPFVCQYGLDCVNGQCEDLCNTTECDDGDICTRDRCSGGVCSWEPRECSFGQRCSTQAGGCVPAPGDPCLLQCLWSECHPRPLDEFEDYETLRTSWLADDETCLQYEGYYSWRLAGVCADGTLFLADFFGLGSETHFFDGTTGQFTSLQSTTDVIDSYCCGRAYWPLDFACEGAVITELICGTDEIEVGDPFSIYLDGFCEPDGHGEDACLINFYEPGPGPWTPPALSDFDDFDTKKAQWLEETYVCGSAAGSNNFRVVGVCDDASVFLSQLYYGDYLTDYFDPSTGEFRARTYQSYEVDATCCGRSFYPELHPCENATITEVVCGTQIEVGQVLTDLNETPCEAAYDPCALPCKYVGDPDCPSFPGPNFERYTTARDYWLSQPGCAGETPYEFGIEVVAGTCADGTQFLLDVYFISHVHYYDPVTDRLIAYIRWDDVVYPDSPCGSETYWPSLFSCEDAVVTEVICTTNDYGYEVGDTIGYLEQNDEP